MTGLEKGLICAIGGVALTLVASAVRLSQPAQQERPVEEPTVTTAACSELAKGWLDCRLQDGTRCVIEQFGESIACDFSANSRLPPLPPCDISTLGLRAGPVQCIFDPHLGHRWKWAPLP